MLRIYIIFFVVLLCLNQYIAQNSSCFAQAPESSAQAQQILAQGLMEKNPTKRREAVIALSLEGAHPTVFQSLTDALADEDALVRMAACASLASLKDRRTIEPLQQALKDPVPEVSFAAAQALWELNDPSGKEVLMAVLTGDKKNSSGYISKQKQEAMRMMKNPGGLFKFVLKTGIGLVPLPGFGTGVSSMESLLRDGNLTGRALAALLLSKDNDEESLQLLRSALLDKDWSVRAAAIHSLALRNNVSVREDLVPLFEDKKEEVRYRAAAAYLRLEAITKSHHKSKRTVINNRQRK